MKKGKRGGDKKKQDKSKKIIGYLKNNMVLKRLKGYTLTHTYTDRHTI